MISKEMTKKVLAFHGLNPDNDDDSKAGEAIENALRPADVQDLKDRADAGDKAREELANRDLEKYANRIGSDEKTKKFYRTSLLSNRDETIAALEAMPEPTTPAPRKEPPVHNRGTAGTPGAVDGGSKNEAKETERAQKVANRARELRAQNPTLQNRAAFDQAESEIPGAV